MAKLKSTFYCQNCGAQAPKWIGRCPQCKEWNTYVEEVIQKNNDKTEWKQTQVSTKIAKPILLNEIDASVQERINTFDLELNRVLGGGIVPGSIILIGGEPGIGKSTLMLQIALSIPKLKVLYVSGEESDQQIKMRADRLFLKSNNCYILPETNTQNIFLQIEHLQPELVIIDSVQTLHSQLIDATPGSVSQIRQCTAELLRYAKETNTPVVLIGHITKEGVIAGPKILEHMVDTVLQFEGDRNYGFRILRSIKNRFGSTSELGIYEMQSKGLVQINNPSEILISHKDEPLSGVAIAANIEGLRAMLIETQALVSSAVYGTPQRSSTGFDLRRLGMLLAVLEKRCGFRLSSKDVFLNITGGIRVDDPAMDLAIVCAILSSNEDIPLPIKYCFAAEVGLSGEIRPVNRIEQRIMEAEKLGFSDVFISAYNFKSLDSKKLAIRVHGVKKVEEVFNQLFG